MREQRARLSKNSDTTKAINYSLNRWDAFTRFLDDGHLCMSNNAAERELRAVALGRKNWTFAGSDEGAAQHVGKPSLRIDIVALGGGACQITPPSAFTNCCPGTGTAKTLLLKLREAPRPPLQNRSALWPSPDAYPQSTVSHRSQFTAFLAVGAFDLAATSVMRKSSTAVPVKSSALSQTAQ